MMGFDFAQVLHFIPPLLKAAPLTLTIVLISIVLAILVGLLAAAANLSRYVLLQRLSQFYLSFIRSTPVLIQLFLIYYGLPVITKQIGIDITGIPRPFFCVTALTLHNGAYLAEVFRPAYLAVDICQKEAARSIGMTGWQSFRRIVLPQALPIALPNLGSCMIDIFKDSALMFTIGLVDIMGQGKILSSQDFGISQLNIYIAIALLYWLVCLFIEQFIRLLENALGKYHLGNGIRRY